LRSADANPRTIGNTLDVNASDSTLGLPSTGDLTFTGVIATGNNPKAFTVSNSFTYFNGVVNGGTNNNNITKNGPGTLVLGAINTYGKPTLVNAGTLLVDGVIGTNSTTVAGGTLGGTGLITGPVIVQSAGTLAPGTSIGTLSISNTLSLGGTNLME